MARIVLLIMLLFMAGCWDDKAQSKEAVYADGIAVESLTGKSGDPANRLDYVHSPYQSSIEWANFGYALSVSTTSIDGNLVPVDGVRIDARVKNVADLLYGNGTDLFSPSNPRFYISDLSGGGVDFLIGDKDLPVWKRWHCVRTSNGTAMFAVGAGQRSFLDGYPDPGEYDPSVWIKRTDRFNYIITVEFRVAKLGCDNESVSVLVDFMFAKMSDQDFAEVAMVCHNHIYEPTTHSPAPGPLPAAENMVCTRTRGHDDPCLAGKFPELPGFPAPAPGADQGMDPNSPDAWSVTKVMFMEQRYYEGFGWYFEEEFGNWPVVFSDSDPCLVSGWVPVDPNEWDIRCTDYIIKPDPNDPNTWQHHYPEPECWNPNAWFQSIIDWSAFKSLIVEVQSPGQIKPFASVPAMLRVLSRPPGTIDYSEHDPNYYYLSDNTPFWYRDIVTECRDKWNSECPWYIDNVEWSGDLHLADWSYDGKVNLEDFALLATYWLDPNITEPLPLWICSAADDPNVDADDLAVLVEHWGTNKWQDGWVPTLDNVYYEAVIELYPYAVSFDGTAVMMYSDWYMCINDPRFAGWHYDSYGNPMLLVPTPPGAVIDVRPLTDYDYYGEYNED